MQRFFVTFPLQIDMSITDADMVHQLTRVLRVQVGENIIMFSWDGSETEYTIIWIDKKSIQLRGQSQKFPNTEPKKKIHLYQAMPNKYEKIEYILQKGVEIGITKFVFFRSDRSQKLLITPAKIERFENIAREALEQCGGMVMPEIRWLEKLPENLEQITDKNYSSIVLDTLWDTVRLSEWNDVQCMALWVWPEGGWSDQERSKMLDNGFIFARFGERVLRTETAGIVIGFGFINW